MNEDLVKIQFNKIIKVVFKDLKVMRWKRKYQINFVEFQMVKLEVIGRNQRRIFNKYSQNELLRKLEVFFFD